MFDVILDYIKEFNVIVKDFSKIDSLVGVVKYGTYKITANVTAVLSQVGKMVSTSKITAKINEILGFKGSTKSENAINANISSLENFKNANCISELTIKQKISSLENLKGRLNNISNIEAEPLFAYFRKIVEFDNKALYELDDLTLEEMDYVLTLMSIENNEQEEVV